MHFRNRRKEGMSEPSQSCMPPSEKASNDDRPNPTVASHSSFSDAPSVASTSKRRHVSLIPLLAIPKVSKSVLVRRGTTGSEPRSRSASVGHNRRISFSASSETGHTEDSDGFVSAVLNSVHSDLSSGNPSAPPRGSPTCDLSSVSTVSQESSQANSPSQSRSNNSDSLGLCIWQFTKNLASRAYHEPILKFLWYFFIEVLVCVIGMVLEVLSVALPILLRVCENAMLLIVNQVYIRRALVFLYEIFKPKRKQDGTEDVASNPSLNGNVPRKYGRLRKLRVQNSGKQRAS